MGILSSFQYYNSRTFSILKKLLKMVREEDNLSYFCTLQRTCFMSVLLTLKHKFSSLFPAGIADVNRTKKGSNLNENPSVLIIHQDSGEADFKKKKKFIQHLKGEYGVRDVLSLAYSDVQETELPEYFAHYKELDYFTRTDLSWRLKPAKTITELNLRKFDVLIDLSHEKCIPLGLLIGASNSSCKVGKAGNPYEGLMDIVIDLPESAGEDEFLKHAEYYLSKLSFK